MKFVDEVTIRVQAGKGGDGCLSFLREKFVPRGGPDGGDGGDGGSVMLVGDVGLNTLVDFRHRRVFRAENGSAGMGKLRRGKSGADCVLPVPLGTLVYDDETGELIGELVLADQHICVAKGGFHGLGNARYKSSTNRAPRQTSPGSAGEERVLRLELRLLADVGLLGLPNAGKSTLVRAVSNARPKCADYPFTTLHPQLGVVFCGYGDSFVISDIPGLIAGASEGAGLGDRFLKHLGRCRVLLHCVDISQPTWLDDIHTIREEVRQSDWVVSDQRIALLLTKIDCLSESDLAERRAACLAAYPDYPIAGCVSSITRVGLDLLCQDLMKQISDREGAAP